MILQVVAYGDPVLKRVADDIDKDYPEFEKLLEDMWETMYNAEGVGLAAPQIGKSIRLFLVDATPFSEEEPELADFKKVFINAEILEEEGDEWAFSEGCLSIPEIREDVNRQETIRIRYQDENFNEFEEEFSGLAARVIQHEYDHIEGVLFTDKLSAMRKRLLSKKLTKIAKGEVRASYKMRFPLANKRR